MSDTIAQTRFENVSKHSNDSLLARGNTLQSNKDRLKLDELMALCTTLQNKVLDLEKTKTSQHNEIASLKWRVKKLEKKDSSRNHKLKRLYKVGLTARVESSRDEESLGEDASKQGRINDIDADEEITLVRQNENVVEEVVDAAQVSTAATTVTITTKEITLAQAFKALKTSKPKVKRIIFQEPGKSTTTTISSQQSQDKDLKINEDEKTSQGEAKKRIKKANIALIETWADIQCTRLMMIIKLAGYKLNDLKLKEFDSIQEMFDRAFKRIYMLVEKKYPLTSSTLTMMLEKKFMIDYESEMAYRLLKFIIKQLKK
ncbi:hypothetical protein Tco_1548785 [Tanacetum coccineum]